MLYHKYWSLETETEVFYYFYFDGFIYIALFFHLQSPFTNFTIVVT